MARIADWFTNGAYSKALEERDNLADTYTGNTGYSLAQSQAIRMANDLARGRASQLNGYTMAGNMPASQRIALAAQAQETLPADMYDFTHSMNQNAINAANMRVAQRQADAMNKYARIAQAIDTGTEALTKGAQLGLSAYTGQDKAPSQTFNNAPTDPNTAVNAQQSQLIGANPDQLFDTPATWDDVYTAHKKAGMNDAQIADKFDNTKWGREGKNYNKWRGPRSTTNDIQFGTYHG